MKDTKFVKGYCAKKNQYFGLEVKKDGCSWKVVNFLPLTSEEGRLASSEVRQDTFYTANNLLSCPTCGSRRIGGCSCATKRGCPGVQNSLINCAYCSNMKIDYSASSYSAGSHREGEVIRLSQGQEVKLTALGGSRLEHIKVKCGWDPSLFGNSMDVDSSIIVLGNTGGELVYFGALTHPSGCVVHHGDDLTGGKDEYIDVYFKKIPSDRDKIVFVINIYKCAERGQTLGKVRNLFISLHEPSSQKALVEYREVGNISRYTALVLGVAYRRGQEWIFKAEGKPSYARDLSELMRECMELYRN